MCDGIPIFSNNKKAFHGIGTSSHSESAEKLKISEDHYLKSEYHWWDKEFEPDHYDSEGIHILKQNGVDIDKATKIAEKYVKKSFSKQSQVIAWLKKTPSEWGRVLDTNNISFIRKVNPKLLTYKNKIKKFQKTPIEKFNPYQAIKLPSLKDMKKRLPAQVWAQVRAQVGDQVWDQVWDQVRDQVRDQVGDQVWATSYWAVKVTLGLPIKHWFFDFLKLGVMVVFVQGKIKVFGKRGKYLGEYDQKDFI